MTGFFTGLITIPYRWLIETSSYLRVKIYSLSNPIIFTIITFIIVYLIGILINKLVTLAPLISGSGIPQARATIYGRLKFNNPVKNLIFKFKSV